MAKLRKALGKVHAMVLALRSRRPIAIAPRSPFVPSPKSQQMELPDQIRLPIQNFTYPTPGREEGQSAALAAGAARDGVGQSPPATLDPTAPALLLLSLRPPPTGRGGWVGGGARKVW